MKLRRNNKDKSNIHPSSVARTDILVSIAIKNLLSKKLRTFLTLLGIVIGAGAVVFLVSLANGLHNVVDQQILNSSSVDTIDVTTPNSENIPLNSNAVNTISHFADTTTVTPAYIIPGKISFQDSQSDVVVYGTDNDYLALSGLKFVSGAQKFSDSNSAIVNTTLLNLIGISSPSDALDKSITIETIITTSSGAEKTITTDSIIVGVIDTGTGTQIYINGQSFTDNQVAQYGQVKVSADGRDSVPAIRTQIEGLGLVAASPLDTLDQINTIFTIFTYVVIGFGGIGIVIAVLGMFNTLTISLLERTSELGLMITMGASKADIQKLLIFESLILSVTGGILGLFDAWLLGKIFNVVLTNIANSRGISGDINAFLITPTLMIITIVATIGVGMLVAFYPSKRASRIDPIDALKHE